MQRFNWTKERLAEAAKVLEKLPLREAAVVLSKKWGVVITKSAIWYAKQKLEDEKRRAEPKGKKASTPRWAPPLEEDAYDDLAEPTYDELPESPLPARDLGDETDDVERLVEAARRGIAFEDLCDALDMSPAKVRALVARAQDAGYGVDVAGDELAWKPSGPRREIVDVSSIAKAGPTRIFANISDLHFGSKYHLRAQLVDFIEHAYEIGVRDITCTGDNVDGIYSHGRWELTHHGFEEQADDFARGLPQLPGLRYWAICGNHDETFEKLSGLVVWRALQDVFRRHGRDDMTMLGSRGATIRFLAPGDHPRGVVVELWHPKKAPAYAQSYHLQKKIEQGYAPGQKPDFLFAGHWHQSVYIPDRGVHGFAAGTFQGGGSPFGKSLGGAAPKIGGWIVKYAVTSDGTVRDVEPKWRAYYENEQPRDVDYRSWEDRSSQL